MESAKRYGEGSEMLVFSRKRRQGNGAESEKLRREKQHTTASSAVLFLVWKGPLENKLRQDS